MEDETAYFDRRKSSGRRIEDLFSSDESDSIQHNNDESFGAGGGGGDLSFSDDRKAPTPKKTPKSATPKKTGKKSEEGSAGEAEEVTVKPEKKAKAVKQTARPKESGGSKSHAAWERRQTFARQGEELARFREETDKTETGRPKRHVIAPLKHWANERFIYKRELNALPVPSMLVRAPEIEESAAPAKRKAARPAPSSKKSKASSSKRARTSTDGESASRSGDDESDGLDPGVTVATAPVKGVVWDPDTSEDKEKLIAMPGEKIEYYTFPDKSTGKAVRAKKVEGPRIAKMINESRFVSGFVSIGPGSTTEEQDPRGSCVSFYVVSGVVEVCVFKSRAVLTKGAQFFIPNHNCYLIRNKSHKKEAVLSYVSIKDQNEI